MRKIFNIIKQYHQEDPEGLPLTIAITAIFVLFYFFILPIILNQ
jgi:hypothetical protein